MMSDAMTPVKVAGYRIEGLLGTGGMSRVYAARQLSVDRRVALKIFEVGGAGGAQAALRLRREAKLLARLDHPNIVRCIDYGDADGVLYLALELVDGESLKQRLDRRGALIGADAVRIALAIARALMHAHEKGVVHRDVKPGNILLARDGKVKLTDFGLARTAEDVEITQAGTALGTPQYLSPEQARSPRRAGSESDVYSLGATLYHMLTGIPPHRGETLAECLSSILFDRVTPPEEIAPTIDPGLSRIVAHSMAKDRSRRYRNAHELHADLERWLAGAADTAIGISWNEASTRVRSQLGRLAGWWVAGLVALLGIGSYWWRSGDREPSVPPIVSANETGPVQALERGSVTPLQALATLGEDAHATLEERARIFEIVRERARAISATARARARQALADGALSTGLERFDRAVRERCIASFGAEHDDLPDDLSRVLDEATASDRLAVEEWQAKILEGADAALSQVRDTLETTHQRALAGFEFELAERSTTALTKDAASIASKQLADALRGVLPEAKAPVLEKELVESLSTGLVEVATRLRQRAAESRRECVADSLDVVAEVAVDPSHTTLEAIASELVSRVAPKLGVRGDELRARWPEVAVAIDERAKALQRERAIAAAARAAERELELANELSDALSRGDLDAAERAASAVLQDGAARVADPWLKALLSALPELRRTESAAVRAFQSSIGKRITVATRSIVKEGVLGDVDGVGRKLLFSQPAIEVAFAELAPAELEHRASSVGPVAPLVSALLRYFGDDPEGARGALAQSAGESWYSAVDAAVADALAGKQAAARGEASRAEQRLAEFDRARSENQLEVATQIADEMLRTPALVRQPSVKARRAEIEKIRESGRALLEERKRREAFARSTHARVDLEKDGSVTLRYDFSTETMLPDIELPGPEWKLTDGRLSALAMLDRRDLPSRIDLYRNRPGLRVSPPLDASRALRAELELVLPLEPSPGLVGVRLGSICFVLRNFPDLSQPGQVTGFVGTLDEYRDYLFDPALGETRPKKAGGGSVRPYRLERGNRYRVRIDCEVGADADYTLSIEGEVVYRFKAATAKRAREFELRVEMPCEIDDLEFVGTPLGAAK